MVLEKMESDCGAVECEAPKLRTRQAQPTSHLLAWRRRLIAREMHSLAASLHCQVSWWSLVVARVSRGVALGWPADVTRVRKRSGATGTATNQEGR